MNAVVAEIVRAPAAGPRDAPRGARPPACRWRPTALMLRRVIENLVGNAVDSLGGPERRRVTVSTEAVGAGGVAQSGSPSTDTGRGMTRAELDRAFDDFITTKAGGTGLGLSIVRRLVLDLGGALRIETEPGAGTRAMVELRERAPMTLVSWSRGGRRRPAGRAVRLRPQPHWAATRCSLAPDGTQALELIAGGAGGLRDPRPRDAGHGRLRGAARAGAEGRRRSR